LERRFQRVLDWRPGFSYIVDMEKDIVITKLREHRSELEAAGAEHVSIFGSVARGGRYRTMPLTHIRGCRETRSGGGRVVPFA
jgi:hypothetical protein